VVTKSYVDEQMEMLIEEINGLNEKYDILLDILLSGDGGQIIIPGPGETTEIVAEVMGQMEILVGGRLTEMEQNMVFDPIFVPAGTVLIGGQGTEIILRSGRASVYSMALNGLTDITRGAEILHGGAVSLDHLLIVPRADTRGLLALEDCTVMVKGTYRLID
jgi:hypothetical protein